MIYKMLYAKCTKPDSGYAYDSKLCKDLLDMEKMYAVKEVYMSGWHTDIILEDFDERYENTPLYKYSFNSVNFDFFDENSNPVDIYSMPEYNPYL